MVQFNIEIAADPRRAEASVRRIEQSLTRLETKADKLRRSLSGAITGGFNRQIAATEKQSRRTSGALSGLVTSFAAISAIRGTLKVIADFDQSLKTLQAVSQATGKELELLSQTAQELGRTTRFTAAQAAEGLTLLARAGFTVQESTQAIAGTLRLAQSANIGLAEAADIAASAVRGFRVDATETNKVVDVLALTSIRANTTISQLGEAIKFVAPVSAGLGVSLEQTNAALGVLSDSGLQASIAGTGLRRVLAELESPSRNSQKILASLGLTAEDVRVSQVGLATALERLADKGLDTGRALEFFGQRGGPAFEVLSSNLPKVRQLTGELERAGGTAEDLANTMDDSLVGASKRVLSAFQGFILNLDNTFNASNNLKTSLDALAGTINVVSEAMGSGLRAAEAEQSLSKVGQRIVSLRKEIRGLETAGQRQGFLSPGQSARLEQLRTRLELLTGSVKAERIAAENAAKAESELAAKRALAADKVQDQSSKLVAAQQPLEKRLQALRDENAVLAVQIAQGDTAARIKEAELQLRQKEVELTPQQLANLQMLITENERLNDVLNKRPAGGEEQRLVIDALQLDTLTEKLQRLDTLQQQGAISSKAYSDALNQLLGKTPETQLAEEIELLNAQFARGRIGLEEYRQKLDELRNTGTSTATTLEQGFRRAFTRMAQEAEDLASVGEKLVDTFANKAVDAIASFAETGKFSFKDFARSLLADIAKIITRLLVVKALSALGGSAGLVANTAGTAISSAATNQGREDGGTVQPGRAFVVGENGPEIFRPGQTGTIVPNPASVQQQAPEVNVSVVNVTDPDEVAGIIESGDVDQAIVNVVARNKDQIRATT